MTAAPKALTRGAVLVTGGFAGVGLAIARSLVDRGARRLVLAGRTPLPPRSEWRGLAADHPAAERIAAVLDLEARGAAVHPLAVDVGDATALSAALDGYAALGYPPIRAVIHSAGVLRDAMLVRLDPADLGAVLRPKLGGALNLAAHFADRPLDLFALFSSLTSVVGRVGQTAYAAANAALDGLARSLRSRGLPAVSIGWGPWGEVGMFSRLAGPAGRVRSLARPMSTARGVEVFARLADAGLAHPVVADFDGLPDAPLFAALPRPVTRAPAAEEAGGGGEPLLELFLVEEAERLDTILARLTAVIGAIFQSPALDARQPLSNLGLDSLMAVEVTDAVRASYGVEVPVQDIFSLSARGLAERVAERVVLDEAALEALLAEVEALPDEPSLNSGDE